MRNRTRPTDLVLMLDDVVRIATPGRTYDGTVTRYKGKASAVVEDVRRRRRWVVDLNTGRSAGGRVTVTKAAADDLDGRRRGWWR
jgi:hypothetical protein